MAAYEKPNEIRISRVYDAPVKAVWDAWTDPKQVAQWWGPRGFTLTTHSKDLRPGGAWNYTMHGPDGTDYPNTTKYHEVEKHAKLVYDHGANENQPPLFRVTVLFSEQRGKTKMEMTMALESAEAATNARAFIKKAGGNSTWDRLAEYVEKEKTGKEKFFINRSFDVPIDVMYEMWTDPAHFQKWLPPTGFEMKFIRADIKPGGTAFYVMTGPNVKMHGNVFYEAFEKPHTIRYRQQFADEHGKVSRHPLAPMWPETMLTTVMLSEEGPERTRVTIEWEPIDKVSPEELDTFIKGRSGMTQGWTGSFDKLEDYVAKLATAPAKR
jgi:uncharacterized protein YndB with AHSA1/START domain